MYLETGNKRYPCADYQPGADTIRFQLEGNLPTVLGGEAVLFQDDGFELTRVTVSDWARWEASGGCLILTNLPEPEPTPEPEEAVPSTEITNDQLAQAMVGMMYEIDTLKLNGGMQQ